MSSPEDFFGRYPRLRITSRTDIRGERLEYRFRTLIERNRELIRGKRVLDLASHDGRWTLAALDAGATYVTGVEGRPELVDEARSTFEAYEISESCYSFILGDCLTILGELPPGSFDTVLCFGFLYHTIHQYDVLHKITILQPSSLLIDSRVVPVDEAAVFLAFNDPKLEGAAISEFPGQESVLVGVPTSLALCLMLDHLGWRAHVQEVLAPATPAGEGIRDYCEERRVCIVASRR